MTRRQNAYTYIGAAILVAYAFAYLGWWEDAEHLRVSLNWIPFGLAWGLWAAGRGVK